MLSFKELLEAPTFEDRIAIMKRESGLSDEKTEKIDRWVLKFGDIAHLAGEIREKEKRLEQMVVELKAELYYEGMTQAVFTKESEEEQVMKTKVRLTIEEFGFPGQSEEDKQLYTGTLLKEIELTALPCPGSFFYYQEGLPPAWISDDSDTTSASVVAHLIFYPDRVEIHGYINDILTKEAIEVLLSWDWAWDEEINAEASK